MFVITRGAHLTHRNTIPYHTDGTIKSTLKTSKHNRTITHQPLHNQQQQQSNIRRKDSTATMMTALAYTAFVVPIPTADEHDDFLATMTLARDIIRNYALPFSPSSLRGRLSASSSRFSIGSFTSDVIDDDESPSTHRYNNHRDDYGGVENGVGYEAEIASGNGSNTVRRRRSARASVLRRLRVLVDERVRLRRTGYVPMDDAIEMQ